MGKPKIYDSNHVTSTFSYIETKHCKHLEHEYVVKDGCYYSKHGIVIIYQTEIVRRRHSHVVLLTFAYNGRTYARTIHGKKYTDIGLARKAGEFVKHIVSGGLHND